MRILFLCNSHVWGGAEKYVYSVATEMANRGHSVYGAAPAHSPLLDRLSSHHLIRTLSIDIGPKLARNSVADLLVRWRRYTNVLRRALAAWHRDFGIELVHVQFKKEQLLVTPLAANLGMAVVWTEHGPLPPAFRRIPPAMWLYRRAARQAKAIICVAEFVASNLVANGIAEQLTHVCRNGIDLRSVVIARENKSMRVSVRRALNLAQDETVIAAIGRITTIKGLHTLLGAAQGLLRVGLRIQILVVGEGPQREELEAQAARLEIDDSVHFIGHREDVNDLLTAIDIVALPSLVEGLPFAAMEAMAAGLPVVATTVGGLPELLDYGRAGALVRPNSTRGLLQVLSNLVRNPARRSALAESGRRRVENLFNEDQMMARTVTLLSDAVGSPDSRARATEQNDVTQR